MVTDDDGMVIVPKCYSAKTAATHNYLFSKHFRSTMSRVYFIFI